MENVVPVRIYTGKTKNVYKGPIIDGVETCFIEYTDNATGVTNANGEVEFDPGQNGVVGTIPNKSSINRKLSNVFFGVLEKAKLATHRVHIDNNANPVEVHTPAGVERCIDVQKIYQCCGADPSWDLVYVCSSFGRGLEWVVRNRLTGSFIRRFGNWADIPDMMPCPPLLEITIKDDRGGDPLIYPNALTLLGIMSVEEYRTINNMVLVANKLIKSQLACGGMDLIDIKFELGKNSHGELMFMDEISLDIMRVYKNGQKVTHDMIEPYLHC